MKLDLHVHAKNYASLLIDLLLRKIATGARFSGDYANWDEACSHAASYDSEVIAKRVMKAALKVKRGEAVFERDSALFDKIQYSWPVLTGLMWIAAQKGNRLRLIDFGGSFGSSYFQARHFLQDLQECSWNIVELARFVDIGKRYFDDEHLKFYADLDACERASHSDAILLSSVLQYLPEPAALLDDIIRRGFNFIIVDRTPFTLRDRDHITVQKVPPSIYPATLPVRIMNLDGFLAKLSVDYELIADFESPERANIPVIFKGFLYRKRRRTAASGNAKP